MSSLRQMLAQQKEDLRKSNQIALSVGGYLAQKKGGTLTPLKQQQQQQKQKQKRAKTSMEAVLGPEMVDPHGDGSSLLRPTSAPLVDPELIRDDQFARRRLHEQQQLRQQKQDIERGQRSEQYERLMGGGVSRSLDLNITSGNDTTTHQGAASPLTPTAHRLPPLQQRPGSASKGTQVYSAPTLAAKSLTTTSSTSAALGTDSEELQPSSPHAAAAKDDDESAAATAAAATDTNDTDHHRLSGDGVLGGSHHHKKQQHRVSIAPPEGEEGQSAAEGHHVKLTSPTLASPPSPTAAVGHAEGGATATTTGGGDTGGTEGLPLASLMKLETQFHALDLNGDGVLDVHEVTVALKKSFPSADKATLMRLSEMMTTGADTNSDGRIDLEEFISYFVRHQADRLNAVENLRQRSTAFLVAAPSGSGFREDPLSHLSPPQVEELVKSFTHYEPEQFEHRYLNRDEVESQVHAVFAAANEDLRADLIEVLFETADRKEGFTGIRIDPSLFFKMFVEETSSMATALGGQGLGAEVANMHQPRSGSAVVNADDWDSSVRADDLTDSKSVHVRVEAVPGHGQSRGSHSESRSTGLMDMLTDGGDSRPLGSSLDIAIQALEDHEGSLSTDDILKIEKLRKMVRRPGSGYSGNTMSGNFSPAGSVADSVYSQPFKAGRSTTSDIVVPMSIGLPTDLSGSRRQSPKSSRHLLLGGVQRIPSALHLSPGDGLDAGGAIERRESTIVQPALDDRVALLFSKLRLISQAPKVYKDMMESRECVVKVNEFAIECAQHLRDVDVLRKVEEAMSAAAGAESGTLLLSDVTGTVLDSYERDTGVTKEELVEMINDGEPLFLEHRYIFPLASEKTYIGVVQLHFDESHPPPTRDSRSYKRALLGGMASVAAMTIQNFFSFREANFHHEKAEAMLRMAKQLSMDNLDEDVLVHSIMNSAKELINANRCSVFLVSDDPVTKGTLTAYFEGSGKVTLPAGTGIAGHVAQTREIVNIPDCYRDTRFNPDVDKKTGYRTTTMLCIPVQYEGQVVGVTQLVNKENGEPFNRRDEDLFATFSTFVAVCLRNCRVHQALVIEKRKSEAILAVAEEVSECDIRDVQKVASHVLKGAKDLMGADRATLFLVDDERHELYSRLVDGTNEETELRFPIGRGIAGIAAEKNTAENISNAYDDPRFNQEYDKQLGYVTQSMLTQPISHQGEVLAVAQLVNKLDKNGKPQSFTTFDEEAFHTFSLFAGISLSNSRLLEFAVKAGQEAMALHSTDAGSLGSLGRRRSSMLKIEDGVNSAMVNRLMDIELGEQWITSSLTKRFDIWSFREAFEEREATRLQQVSNRTSDACVTLLTKMIMGTGLPAMFDCEEKVLCRFIASCRSKYRNVPYHNFYHAVDVCQTICAYIRDGKLTQLLPPLQQYVLIITALVHDLDHMGVNNSFHLKTDSPLGMLSSASGNNSVLEVHHCNVAIAILDDPNKNVFAGLEKDQLTTAFKQMIECVLATDMARHGGLMENFNALVVQCTEQNELTAAIAAEEEEEGATPTAGPELVINSVAASHNNSAESLLLAMQVILKAADISNVTKQFDISRKWGMAVTEEFYRQGDAEKAKGVSVMAMFDRSAHNELAKGQLGFIDFLAEPFFKMVVRAFPTLTWLTDNITNNKMRWKSVLAERQGSAMLSSQRSASFTKD